MGPRAARLTAARVAALLLAWLAFAGAALAAEAPLDPTEYVTIQEGTLPIIVAAPHGGRLDLPGVPPREGKGIKRGPGGFVAAGDLNTDLLAQALVAALEERLGARPYLVMARFKRQYVDANRPVETAVETRRAKPVYQLYHATLRRFCAEVRKAHGLGLLLDVHAQALARDTVFRGTNDGASDRALVKRFGERVHAGPESLGGLLVAHGVKVVPVDASPEHPSYRGGYTTYTYGRHDGIGATQLEFGPDFLAKDRIASTAAKVADAVADFARRYLLDRAR